MSKVGVSAFGGTSFTTEGRPIGEIMFDAARSLLQSNDNIDRKDIDTVLVSTNDNTKYLGAIVSESVGIRPRISHSVESMCSSGANAIVSAYSYIASGLGSAALVVGADRFDGPGQILEWDESRGEFRHPIFWASLFSKSYKSRLGADPEDLASIPAKNHRNAQDNPNAISRKAYSIEEVLGSRKLTEDLRLLECSRPSTGGSAVLLTSEVLTAEITDEPVWISGIGQRTTSAGFTRTEDLAGMRSTQDAARQAFDMAGIGPGCVDVAEVHDAFAVCEALAVEDTGMAKKGLGARFSRELFETGSRMVNPRGGLIGSGHPPGATGVAQTAEIVQQLQGKAERRQADSPQVGLVHNMSAAATSSTVLVMTR